MRQAGVEVRGITQPDGTAEFCEVFFTDARCPKDNVVGGVNNGWKVANSTLAFERGQSATTGYRRFEDEYKLLVEQAAANGAPRRSGRPSAPDPVLHQDPTAAHQRVAIVVGDLVGRQGPWRCRARGDQQDVLERDAQRGDGARPRRVRCRRRCSSTPDPTAGSWPGAVRDKRRPGYLVSPMMQRVLLQPQRDDLGWHQPDPAQHRRRARPRPSERAVVITTVGV